MLGPGWYPGSTVAAQAARDLKAACLVDIGCGRAQKLMALAGEFDTVGIDFGANLDHCRRQYPDRTWLECDLDRPHTLPVSPSDLERSVIVCSDLLEHLVRPEHLLTSLRAALRHAPLLILSTPERDLCRGVRDLGPPANACHIREWNLAELAALLEHHGLPTRRIGLTRSDDRWENCHTILVQVAGRRRRLSAPAQPIRSR